MVNDLEVATSDEDEDLMQRTEWELYASTAINADFNPG